MEMPPNETTNMPFPEDFGTAGIDYFSDDIDPAEMALPATLERVSILAAEAKILESQIVEANIVLETLSGKLDKIVKVQLPDIMLELGMKEFKLVDGSTVSIVDSINASISEDNKPAAFKWLEDNKFDGIIKTKVASEFGKGEYDKALAAQKVLQESGVMATIDRSIHPATLKSFVKERLAEAGNIEDGSVERAPAILPQAVFGVFEFKIAKIKSPAAKKPSKKK